MKSLVFVFATVWLACSTDLLTCQTGFYGRDQSGYAAGQYGQHGSVQTQSGRSGQGRRGGRGGGGGGGGGRGGGGSTNMLHRALDKNRDIHLSVEELIEATKSLLLLDTNRDGALSPLEMQDPSVFAPRNDYSKQRQQADAAEMQLFVKREVAKIMSYDSDRDGQVSVEEMKERIMQYFEQVDKNKDDTIDQNEAESVAKKLWSSNRLSR